MTKLALSATTGTQYRRCKLQREFTITAVGYSEILNPCYSLQWGTSKLFKYFANLKQKSKSFSLETWVPHRVDP
jgi:hypothetical protein